MFFQDSDNSENIQTLQNSFVYRGSTMDIPIDAEPHPLPRLASGITPRFCYNEKAFRSAGALVHPRPASGTTPCHWTIAHDLHDSGRR